MQNAQCLISTFSFCSIFVWFSCIYLLLIPSSCPAFGNVSLQVSICSAFHFYLFHSSDTNKWQPHLSLFLEKCARLIKGTNKLLFFFLLKSTLLLKRPAVSPGHEDACYIPVLIMNLIKQYPHAVIYIFRQHPGLEESHKDHQSNYCFDYISSSDS